MTDLLASILVGVGSSGLLLWFGKFLLEKSIEAKLSLETGKINLLRHGDLEYKKDQIKYLYGPLYGLLKTNRKMYNMWMGGELKDINLPIKKLFKENNEKAISLIIENSHLVDLIPMPEHFVKYVTSVNIWSMYCADTEHGTLPEELSSNEYVKWCQEFEDHVFQTYEQLSRELSKLYQLYEIKK